MTLLTTDDLATALRTEFDPGSAEEAQAQYFCDAVSAYMGEELGISFTSAERTERLQADYDGIVCLPVSPVTEVASISTIDSQARSGWAWDGIDEIDGLESHEVVDVTYTAGMAEPPAVLSKIAVAVACRLYTNPSGIRQQTIGAISETYAASSGDAGTIYFTPMEREIIGRYKTTMETWRIGPRSNLWNPSRSLPTL